MMIKVMPRDAAAPGIGYTVKFTKINAFCESIELTKAASFEAISRIFQRFAVQVQPVSPAISCRKLSRTESSAGIQDRLIMQCDCGLLLTIS